MEIMDQQRIGVRCIVWLDGGGGFAVRVEQENPGRDGAFAAWEIMNQNPRKDAIPKYARCSGAPRTRVALSVLHGSGPFSRNARSDLTRLRSATVGCEDVLTRPFLQPKESHSIFVEDIPSLFRRQKRRQHTG